MTSGSPRRGWTVVAVIALVGLAEAVGSRLASAQENQTRPGFAKEALEASLADGARRLDSSEFDSARRSFEEAVCWAGALSDRPSLAKAWSGLGRAQWSSGDNSRSLASHERALAIRALLGDPEPLALALNAVGLALYSTGRHAEALDYYFRGLERAVTPETRALLLLNIGLVFRYQARFQDADNVLREALAIRRNGGSPRQTALVLNALGLLARVSGRYGDALGWHGEALAIRRAEKDRFGEAQSLNNMATVYGDQGEMEKSLEVHREALRIAEEIGYGRQIALSHENIGAELDNLGRPKQALEEARGAIALYRKNDDRSNLANTLSNAGGYLIELKQPAEARALLIEALAIARSIGEPEHEIMSLQGLAEADIDDGRPADAIPRLDAALEAASKPGFTALGWKVRYVRARALSALGRREESVSDLKAAIATIQVLRTQIGTDAGKIGFVDGCQDVFEMLAVELFAASRPGEALEIAEAGRARALADLLSQRQMLGKSADRIALAQVRGAQARARNAERAGAGADDAAGARGAEVETAVERLRDRNPELASLFAVESPDLAEIGATARRLRATIVEFLSAKDACYAWVVGPDGEVHSLRLEITRERLSEMVRAVREELDSADLRRPAPRRLVARLRELDARLIAPAEPWLPRSPDALVVIVPHGPLALLPFAAVADRRGRTLLERHTLFFAPAVSSLRYTAAKIRNREPGGRALIVADPVPPRGSGLASLPGARAEAASIARRLGPGTTTLSGRDATEAAVKRAAGAPSILHFATHGLISEERPLASSLLLGEGDGEDGYLRVDEIFGLDLHADLVVLSGCRTGLGRLSGDGILGLTRAFLYAGTPSIVVSEWDVSDRATVFLMDRFYAQIAAGRGKARALRSAQLAARRRFSHPAAWSAFVLVGEP